MAAKRIYIETGITPDAEHALSQEQAHYIGRVLRARIGDTLELFDGQGHSTTAEVRTLGKREAIVLTSSVVFADDRSPVSTTLLQCLSRSHKIDLVVQKAVELGVDHVVPITSERSLMRLDEAGGAQKQAHWMKVAIAACQQCGRRFLPTISTPLSLDAALREIRAEQRLVATPGASHTLTSKLEQPAPADAAILVGPEGGFSSDEIDAAVAAGWVRVSAGRRVMRTETAAISLLSIIQHRWGDLV
ncbi:MAG: 16S rRNA (uracil(1498)-N(3))-methyltransferase [Pseudomonadota bacterium]